jgi:thiol reductant ABC exporter CydC subunit
VIGLDRRLLGLVAPARAPLLAATTLMALTVGAGIALMGTSTWLIATAAGHPSIAVLQVAVVGVRGFGIGRAVLRYLERLVAHDATLRVLSRLRTWLFQRVIPLAPAGLGGSHSGDLLSRMVGDVEALDHAFLRIVGPTLSAGLVTLLVVAAVSRFDVRLAAIVAAGFVAAGAVAPWLASRAGRSASGAVVRRIARLQVAAVDLAQGVADLLSLGRHRDHARKLDALGRSVAVAHVRAVQVAAAGGAFAGFTADLTVAAMIAVAVHAAGGTLGGVTVAVLAMVALAAFESATALPGAYQRLGGTRAAGRRLLEFIDSPPPVAVPDHPVPVPPGLVVDVRNLTFGYGGSRDPVLRDVSFRLAAGRALAIVGPSGAGKSSVIGLLLRFWDVPDGTVFLDGIDVRRLDPDEVRSRFAVVSQRTHLFTGTLRENLRLARPTASDDEIARAATRAGLHDVIASWPHGYDTWIGEQGVQLSGGERRRLALARAFLVDTPVLLLDEPTADLDPQAELRVLAEVARLARDRAVLLVTHRLSGLQAFSEILVMDEGRVVERGSFPGLRNARGPFRDLLDAQRAVLAIDEELPATPY